MEHTTWYFPQAGKEHTGAVLRLVAAHALTGLQIMDAGLLQSDEEILCKPRF